MSKTLHVPRLSLPASARLLASAMDEAGIPWHDINCQPWAEDYPYKPQVRFRIAHSCQQIMLHFRVEEETVAALATGDNGRVWEDSCVEFFLQPQGEGIYYNIECNCAGCLLVGAGEGKGERTHAPQQTLRAVSRWTSLGSGNFAARPQGEPWQLSLIIPVSALYCHDIASLSGLRASGNFYKCGDLLPKPHFLSWSPISLPAPNFHCPDFFGSITFE